MGRLRDQDSGIEKIMSHITNDNLKETLYEEGIELGIERGLTGTELEEFAFQYMQKEMERE